MRINTLDDLQAVKAEGVKLTYPEKIKIMVGMATCGISAGGDKVYPALAKKIAELGLDVALEALKECIGKRKATPADLWKYAKVCRVANVMRPYLEAIE